MRVSLIAVVALALVASAVGQPCSTAGTVPQYLKHDNTGQLSGDCSCAVESLPLTTSNPVVLHIASGVDNNYPRLESTRFESNNLIIAIKESVKYFDGQLFNSPACRAVFTTTSVATSVADSKASPTGCDRMRVLVAPWASVYAENVNPCGLTRQITPSGSVEFVFDFAWENKEKVVTKTPAGREIVRDRVLLHKTPFTITLPVTVNVTSSNIAIAAPVLLIAAVTEQLVVGDVTDPATIRANMKVVTSLQWPFSISSVAWGTVASSVDAPPVPAIDNTDCTTADNSECKQVFSWAYTPASGSCNVNGDYSHLYELSCRSADCPLDLATDDASFGFTLASSSHCPVIADSIALSARVTTHASDDSAKDDFLNSQVITFKVHVKAAQASITATKIVSAIIQRGAVGAPITAVANGNIVGAFSTDFGPVTNALGLAAGVNAESTSSLTFRVNSVALGLAQDEIKPITIDFVVAVQYANAGQVNLVSTTTEVLSSSGRATSEVSGSFRAAGPVSAAPSSSSKASYAGLSAPAAGVALVAIVAAVAAAVVVTARVRANRVVQRYKVVEAETSA